MSEVTIYHNPRCSKSRQALGELTAEGVRHRVVQYLKEHLGREELSDLLTILEDAPAALVRRDARFKDLGLTAADVETSEQVVDVLVRHPELMERPVLVKGRRAIIGRPTERVGPFVTG